MTAPRRLGHRSALDAIRGASWFCVFCAHGSIFPIPGFGDVAMYVFFVLSGFLITELLVEEKLLRGSISLRRFFYRRALRLLPALVLFLAAWLAVVAVFGHDPWMTTVPGGGKGAGEPLGIALQGVGAALAYMTNWVEIFNGLSGYVPLGHLWSLAVEEQLYVLWAPLLALLLLRFRRRVAAAVALILASLSTLELTSLWHGGPSDRLSMGTDTRAGAFLLGGALALAWSQGAFRSLANKVANRGAFIASFVVLAICAVPLGHPHGKSEYVLAWTMATLASATLVVSAVEGDSGQLARSHIGRVLTYLGRRSYALYLWHYVWLTWLRDLGGTGIALALVFTLCSAELSWHLVEKRFLKLKDRRVVTPRIARDGLPPLVAAPSA